MPMIAILKVKTLSCYLLTAKLGENITRGKRKLKRKMKLERRGELGCKLPR
jgi:hypothetical protein